MNPVLCAGQPARSRKWASRSVNGQSAPAAATAVIASTAGRCTFHNRGCRHTTKAPPTSTTTKAKWITGTATART